MTRITSTTPEAIAIDDVEKSLGLDHASLFKTLKDLQDDEIKPAIKLQFTVLYSLLTQKIENIIDQRMQIVSNI